MGQSAKDKAQIERFLEAARNLRCDEDKDRFEAKLGEIARHKPMPAKQNKPKTTKPAK